VQHSTAHVRKENRLMMFQLRSQPHGCGPHHLIYLSIDRREQLELEASFNLTGSVELFSGEGSVRIHACHEVPHEKPAVGRGRGRAVQNATIFPAWD
jgi:hypothetical protein